MTMASFTPKHFDWRLERRIATIRLTRAERKNPLTFDSYAELRDTFRALSGAEDVGAVVFASNGGHFCSGGDVHEIIGPLLDRDMKGLLAFTRLTGELVKAIRALPATGDRGRRWRLRRRRRDDCAGRRSAARHAGGEGGVPVHAGSASPDATWAPARCFPASSARGARRSCSSRAGR